MTAIGIGIGIPFKAGASGGAAVVASPNLGAGAAAWWEVADLDTLFVERTGASATTAASVDGVVGTVLDKSGTGFHLVAPSDAARPVLRQSGSQYYLEFDGTDDFLVSTQTISGAGVMTAAAFEYWAAVQFRAGGVNTTTYTLPGLFRTSNGGFLLFGGYRDDTTPNRVYALNFDGSVDENYIEHDMTTATVYHCRHDSGNIVQSANAGTEGSFASGNTSNLGGSAQICYHGGGGGATPAAANWYGGIIVPSVLTSGERAENHTYIGALMGLSI